MSSIRGLKAHYGHPGRAVYDLESGKWRFQRDLTSTRYVRILEDRTPQDDRPRHGGEDLSTTLAPEKRTSRVQHFLQANPELQFAQNVVPRLESVSEMITSNTTQVDPSLGDLVAFGYANRGGKYRKPRILVSADGLNGDSIRIEEIQEELRSWTKGYASHLRMPRIVGQSAWWVGDGAPVRQISFSDPENRTDIFFAVRFSGYTMLFRPTLQDNFIESNAPPGRQYPPSHIDPCPFIKIPVSATGGSLHADVAFSPSDKRWFAIVDQSLKWTVYNIGKGTESEARRLKATVHSQGQVELTGTTEPPSGKEDGWARVMFVGDDRTLLVCSRRKALLFSAKRADKDVPPVAVTVEKEAWIIDFCRRPGRRDEIFMLTTSGIYWYRFSRPQDQDGIGEMSLRLCWKHFSNDQDVSLSLSLSEENNVIHTILFSRLHESATYLDFSDKEASASPPRVSTPVTLRGLFQGSEGSNAKSVQTIVLSVLPMRQFVLRKGNASRTSQDLDRGLLYQRRGVFFFSVFVLPKNQTRRQYIVSVSKDPLTPQLPSVLLQGLSKLHRSSAFVEERDTFLDQANSELDSDASAAYKQKNRWRMARRDSNDKFLLSLVRITRDLRQSTRMGASTFLLRKRQPRMGIQDFSRLLDRYLRVVQQGLKNRLQNISEVAFSLPGVSGAIREDSRTLQRLWTKYSGNKDHHRPSLRIDNDSFKLILDMPPANEKITIWNIFLLFLAQWGPRMPQYHRPGCLTRKAEIILSAATDIFFATSTIVSRTGDVEARTDGSSLGKTQKPTKGMGKHRASERLESQSEHGPDTSNTTGPISNSSVFAGVENLYDRLSMLRVDRARQRKVRPKGKSKSRPVAGEDMKFEPVAGGNTPPIVIPSGLEDEEDRNRETRLETEDEEAARNPSAPGRHEHVEEDFDDAKERDASENNLEQEILGYIDATWKLGIDPTETDWSRLIQRYVTMDGEVEVEIDARTAARQERRKLREAMKMDRSQREDIEADAIPTEHARRPAAPGARPSALHGSRSSPAPRPPMVGISSQAVFESSQVVASQIVGGRHGGRPEKKKKRKRAEGF
ncbi:hypothetical protein P152DRAFT_483878 [Eremomyces bilateralis CBS 781.70]|uniref:RNA polymerase I-specific transcription initiation factor RRN6-like protein n=1 Tax=Eremomyces bilateralis CBS 781.70 TaxID=1392243 RepID=A0A6G1FXA8_9PEZI|nr:uncharacterized protein P152DRAFT_483878 [Eremomyces bilateralis CBS 781.70]KAF1810414.1 hypothetical protein P152DRAFT_483878 [Eremomyces bilateralis CBS 781.70]